MNFCQPFKKVESVTLLQIFYTPLKFFLFVSIILTSLTVSPVFSQTSTQLAQSDTKLAKNNLAIKECANALAHRPAMKAYLIPIDIYPVGLFKSEVYVVLNEALGRLYSTNKKVSDANLIELNEEGIAFLNKALKSQGLSHYSPNALYILNWRGQGVQNRRYIVDHYVSNEAVRAGNSAPRVHVDEIIPKERQDILISLSDRLEKHPNMQAYLFAGSKVEDDGTRMILTIWNSAAAKLNGHASSYSSLPQGQAYMELTQKGIDLVFPDGDYRDYVFYQVNWDITIEGREKIIFLGKQLKNNIGE